MGIKIVARLFHFSGKFGINAVKAFGYRYGVAGFSAYLPASYV